VFGWIIVKAGVRRQGSGGRRQEAVLNLVDDMADLFVEGGFLGLGGGFSFGVAEGFQFAEGAEGRSWISIGSDFFEIFNVERSGFHCGVVECQATCTAGVKLRNLPVVMRWLRKVAAMPRAQDSLIMTLIFLFGTANA